MDDWDSQILHMISNKPYQTECCHCAGEIYLLCLPQKALICSFLEVRLWILLSGHFISPLGVFRSLIIHVNKLSVAIVNKFNQCILGTLACCSVVQDYFQQVGYAGLVEHAHVPLHA